MLDSSIFSRIKTKQDFDREREEFEARKRQQAMQEQLGGLQVMQAQRSLSQPEQLGMEQLLSKAIQGGGVQNLSPAEQAQLQAYDIAQRTKQSVDPRGNIVTNRSVFDMLPSQINKLPPNQVLNTPTSMNSFSGGAGVDPMVAANQAAAAARAAELGQANMPNTQGQLQPPQNKIVTVNPADFGVTSPYGQEDVNKKTAEANIELQKGTLEADTAASQSAATTLGNERAKQQAVQELRQTVLPTIRQNVSAIRQEIQKLPSGGLEDAVGRGVNFFGLPVESQAAKSAINAPLKAIVLDMKRIVRDAGEGIFTKDDQDFVESFVFDPTDELSNKIASFQAFDDVLNRIEQQLNNQPLEGQIRRNAPGFGYIGRVK
jgi:hypothetical protein